MKKSVAVLVLLLAACSALRAQTISSVSFQQIADGSGMVIVDYQLSGEPSTIQLEVSLDAGYLFNTIPQEFLSGDVGESVYPGQNTIYVDFASYANVYSDLVKFRVRSLMVPVIPSTTKVVDETTEIQSFDSESGVIELLSLEDPGYQVGDVLVGNQQYPFLRRIVSVETVRMRDGWFTRVLTELVELVDAVTSGEFIGTICMDPDEMRVEYMAPGVQMSHDRFGYVFGGSLWSGNVGPAHVSVTMPNSHFSYNTCVDVACRVQDLHLEQFKLQTRIPATLAVNVRAEASAGFAREDSVLITTFNMGTVHFAIGPVPVFMTFYLDLYVGYAFSAEVNGYIQTGFSYHTTFKSGAEYENGQWSPINEFTDSFDAAEPDWNVSGQMSASGCMRTDLRALLYSVAGPRVGLRPYMRWEGLAELNPEHWEWSLYAGLDATLGFQVEILDDALAYSWNGNLIERLIAEDSGPENDPPNPVFTSSATYGTVGTEFSFDPSGTWDDLSEPDELTYQWDFNGDGVWDTGLLGREIVSHTFNDPGAFDVTLQVCDPYDECATVSHTVTVGVGTGDVIVTLSWDNTSDMDLHVYEPSGEHIWYAHTSSATGGQLDFDDTNGYGPENIFWPPDSAPLGEYTVQVHHYAGVSPTNYTVVVQAFGWSQTYSGSVGYHGTNTIVTFNPQGPLMARTGELETVEHQEMPGKN